MSRPRPKKLLVYLDQNFISEMAKPRDKPRRLEFAKLYELLHEGFWGEKIVVLRSAFHDAETSLSGALKGPIRTRQSTIGHVDLEGPEEIKENQVLASLQKHLGQPDARDVISFEDVFEEEPDRRVGHLDIRVDTDAMHSDEKEKRERIATELDGVRKRILRDSVSYAEQFAIEMQWERSDALSKSRLYAAAADVTIEQFAEFVNSKAFAAIPIINLQVSLLAKLMTAHATREIERGDATDIDAMATYLPYCDVYGADRFTAGVARSIGVPDKYGCKLFDSSAKVEAGSKGVRALVEHLRKRIDEMAPVNVPVLSIFVASDDGIRRNSFAFFQKIGSQAKRAENYLGAWIEVFGFDDGSRSRSELPFFGLQEVMVEKCEAGATKEALLDICRKACRSSHFVLVDTYQDLPDDFIASALGAQMNGVSTVLGYRIYRRTSRLGE